MTDQQSRKRVLGKGCLFLFCIVIAAYLLIVGIEEIIYKRVQQGGWVTYPLKNSPLEDDHIVALFADDEGKVWIGTPKGLYVLSPEGTRTIYTEYNSGLENGNVWAIVVDKAGKTWVGTFEGLYVLDPSGQWTTYIKPGKDSETVRALAVDPKNRVWVGTNRGLRVFDPDGTATIYTVDNSELGSDDVFTLAVDRLGKIWIGTYDTIGMVDQEGHWTTYHVPDNSYSYSSIWIDHQDRVWLGTALGIYMLESNDKQADFEAFRKPPLTSTYIETIVMDEQNRLWAATSHELVVMNPNGSTRVYNFSNSDLQEQVRALAIDKNGNLWVGKQYGLSMIDLRKGLPQITSTRWLTVRNALLTPIQGIKLLFFPVRLRDWGILYIIFLLLVPLSFIGIVKSDRHYDAAIFYGSVLVLILSIIGLRLIWLLLYLYL